MAKGKGFGGMPGNMQQLMKQAQKMQDNLKQIQGDADKIIASASAGGGAIEVEANGEGTVLKVVLQKEIVDPEDVEMLQDLIMAATNEALKKAKGEFEAKLKDATGGMNIPGLF